MTLWTVAYISLSIIGFGVFANLGYEQGVKAGRSSGYLAGWVDGRKRGLK